LDQEIQNSGSSPTPPDSRSSAKREVRTMEQVGGSNPRSQICDGSAEIKEIRIPGGHERRKGEVFWGFGIEEGEEEEVEVEVGGRRSYWQWRLWSLRVFLNPKYFMHLLVLYSCFNLCPSVLRLRNFAEERKMRIFFKSHSICIKLLKT
jgi:hypothetical protein